MSTRAGVGRSIQRDSSAAGAEAALAARAGLDDGGADFALVFATAGHDLEAVLAAVTDQLPGAKLSGCSCEGIIAGTASDESERAVVVLAVRSAGIGFETFLVRDYAVDPAGAGLELARRVAEVSKGDEFALLLFPDGLSGNAGELLRVLRENLPRPIPTYGGTAGDSLVFEGTFQFEGREVVRGGLAAVLLRGSGSVECVVSHGCMPFGGERRVTRADGAWVHEIDGRPAWSVFRQYLEGEPDELNSEGALHLSVGEALPDEIAGEYEPLLIRTPMGLDKATGSLFFPGGGIREGARIRLTRRDPDTIADSARQSARRLVGRRAGRQPAFVLQFDCAGRGKQLFGSRAAEHILRPLQEAVATEAPWVGFHTYGEIAPIGGESHYHNFSVALCAIYADD